MRNYWLTTSEHMDGAACKAAMSTATRLRIHLQSIKLIRNNFISFPIPASSAAGAQEKLVKDLDAVMQQIRCGSPDITKYADQCILPSVQNIQDTYSNLQQRVLDEARRKVEAQGLALAKTLTANISEPDATEVAEKDCDQDTDIPTELIDSQSLLELEPISEDSLNDQLARLQEIRLANCRRALSAVIDLQSYSLGDFYEQCNNPSKEIKLYSAGVNVFIIDNKTSGLNAGLARTIQSMLEYFSKESSTALVFSEPRSFDFWKSVFCENAKKHLKWNWIQTVVIIPEQSAATVASNDKLKTVTEFMMVFSRLSSVQFKHNVAELLVSFGEQRPYGYNVNVIQSKIYLFCVQVNSRC